MHTAAATFAVLLGQSQSVSACHSLLLPLALTRLALLVFAMRSVSPSLARYSTFSCAAAHACQYHGDTSWLITSSTHHGYTSWLHMMSHKLITHHCHQQPRTWLALHTADSTLAWMVCSRDYVTCTSLGCSRLYVDKNIDIHLHTPLHVYDCASRAAPAMPSPGCT